MPCFQDLGSGRQDRGWWGVDTYKCSKTPVTPSCSPKIAGPWKRGNCVYTKGLSAKNNRKRFHGCYCCSVAKLCPTLRPPGLKHARLPWASLSLGVCSNSCPLSWWCYPTVSSSVTPSPPAFNLSQHQGLFSELAVYIRLPNYWSFNFSIHPSNKYFGLISFRIDWFDLLGVQGTLKSLLQHHRMKENESESEVTQLCPTLWPPGL